jgi:hypothetical protein
MLSTVVLHALQSVHPTIDVDDGVLEYCANIVQAAVDDRTINKNTVEQNQTNVIQDLLQDTIDLHIDMRCTPNASFGYVSFYILDY